VYYTSLYIYVKVN